MFFNDLNCCGVKELVSDGYLPSKTDFKYQLKEDLYEQYYSEMDWDKPIQGGNYHTGSLIATATDSQKAYKKWLARNGFEKVKRFKNHNTGNWVTLYLYVIEKEKGDSR